MANVAGTAVVLGTATCHELAFGPIADVSYLGDLVRVGRNVQDAVDTFGPVSAIMKITGGPRPSEPTDVPAGSGPAPEQSSSCCPRRGRPVAEVGFDL